jgi:hypothetical protein
LTVRLFPAVAEPTAASPVRVNPAKEAVVESEVKSWLTSESNSTVRVLLVVPPATVKPVATEVRVKPLNFVAARFPVPVVYVNADESTNNPPVEMYGTLVAVNPVMVRVVPLKGSA